MQKLQMPKILTIDDELLVRRSFCFFLEDLGYQVFEADSGQKGLDLATQEQPDLILLDLRMPDMNGLQTLAKLKAAHAKIPVIVISGTGDIRDVVEALRRGANDYLTKPITNLQILEHAVSRSLESSRLRKENQAYQKSLEAEVKKRTLALEDAYKQLATSKQTLDALFQAAPLAIVLLDRNLKVTLWNRGAEHLFGWRADEVEGGSCPLFRNLDQEVLRFITSPELKNHEQVFVNREAESLTLKLSTAALDKGPDDSREIVMLFENITEKKRLQNEADQANRLASLGQLAAGVAHEINNPNGLILLNMPTLRDFLQDALQLLSETHPTSKIGGLSLKRAQEIAPQLTHEMEDAARRIRQIVDDLKNFASRDSREAITHFDLNDSIMKAIRLANSTIKKATNSFSYQLGENLPLVQGNTQQIEQVIVNLLVNASESLNDKTAKLQLISLINATEKSVELKVIDQGGGIKPDDMKHITDPFFTTKRETGGTGLGLSVSARIIREHGGQLTFDSQWGQGTCATLSLPFVPET